MTTPAEGPPLLRRFDHWWFGYGSPTSLGLFRILVCLIALLNLLMLAGDWRTWFGENGFMPAWLAHATFPGHEPIGFGLSIPRLGLLGGVTDPRVGMAFFAFTAVVALTTALGLWTRVSAFLLAICVVSLDHRNTTILHGGDTIMRIALLYLAVSPCGRACSLDRLFRLRWGEETGPVEVPLYGQRLVQFNLALVYMTTVWLKYFGPLWMNGTATWYTSRIAEFHRLPVPSLVIDLPMVYVTTYGTILVEISLATLVFVPPLRKTVLFAGVMLHGFIEYSMNIPLFSFLMVSGYVCHFDGEEISAYCRRTGDRLRALMGLEVYLPPGVALNENGERFLHAVDPFGFVRYVPNAYPRERDLGWDAKKSNGKPTNPFRGVAFRAPGAWPLFVVPGLWRRLMLGCAEAA